MKKRHKRNADSLWSFRSLKSNPGARPLIISWAPGDERGRLAANLRVHEGQAISPGQRRGSSALKVRLKAVAAYFAEQALTRLTLLWHRICLHWWSLMLQNSGILFFWCSPPTSAQGNPRVPPHHHYSSGKVNLRIRALGTRAEGFQEAVSSKQSTTHTHFGFRPGEGLVVRSSCGELKRQRVLLSLFSCQEHVGSKSQLP